MSSRAALCAVLAATACISTPHQAVEKAWDELGVGQVEEAIATLESVWDLPPRSARLREVLGWAYYRRARTAFQIQSFDQYEHDLERAIEAWIQSLRINSNFPAAHEMMGAVLLFQGDLKGALRSFRNAQSLDPWSGVGCARLAQALIYDGNLEEAQQWIEEAQRCKPYPAAAELSLALVEWHRGNITRARNHLRSAYQLDPEIVATLNNASASEPIRTFEDFASQCCLTPECGPYMETPCKELGIQVPQREVPPRTLEREKRLETERRRKLNEIYRNRPDLQLPMHPVEIVE